MLACWIYCLGLTHSRASTQGKYTNLADGSDSAQMLHDAVFLPEKSLTLAEICSAAAMDEKWTYGAVLQFHRD